MPHRLCYHHCRPLPAPHDAGPWGGLDGGPSAPHETGPVASLPWQRPLTAIPPHPLRARLPGTSHRLGWAQGGPGSGVRATWSQVNRAEAGIAQPPPSQRAHFPVLPQQGHPRPPPPARSCLNSHCPPSASPWAPGHAQVLGLSGLLDLFPGQASGPGSTPPLRPQKALQGPPRASVRGGRGAGGEQQPRGRQPAPA